MTHRRRILVLRFGAIALMAFGVIGLATDSHGWAGLGVRAAWALTAYLVALRLRSRPDRPRAALMVLTVSSAAFFTALLALEGGTAAVGFSLFATTPIIFAVLLPGEVEVVVGAAISTTVFGSALLAVSGLEGPIIAQWVVVLVTSDLLAVYAVVLHRRMMESEVSMNRDRLRALEAAHRAAEARAEQLGLFGLLASGLGHEVNNPLAAIDMGLREIAEHLQQEGPSTAEDRGILDECETASQRIAAAIRELRAFVPREAEVAACDLVELAREVSSEGVPVVLHDELPPQLPKVLANEDQLREIIRHLLIGISRAAGHEDQAPTPTVWLRSAVGDDRVCLVVEDDGPAPTILELDERPESRRALYCRGPSSGLGLELVRESLRGWGGDLKIAARDEKGLRVSLCLPVAAGAAGSASL